MDGGAQAGLVAMAGHAFGVWELGPQREALLQWDLGVSAGPARVAGTHGRNLHEAKQGLGLCTGDSIFFQFW